MLGRCHPHQSGENIDGFIPNNLNRNENRNPNLAGLLSIGETAFCLFPARFHCTVLYIRSRSTSLKLHGKPLSAIICCLFDHTSILDIFLHPAFGMRLTVCATPLSSFPRHRDKRNKRESRVIVLRTTSPSAGLQGCTTACRSSPPKSGLYFAASITSVSSFDQFTTPEATQSSRTLPRGRHIFPGGASFMYIMIEVPTRCFHRPSLHSWISHGFRPENR